MNELDDYYELTPDQAMMLFDLYINSKTCTYSDTPLYRGCIKLGFLAENKKGRYAVTDKYKRVYKTLHGLSELDDLYKDLVRESRKRPI